MNERDTPPADPKQGQLLDEASMWFARMRGPDADSYRPDFEAWLKRGALHRAAYNRVAEVFTMGKRLKQKKPAESLFLRKSIRVLIAAGALCLFALILGRDRLIVGDPTISSRQANGDRSSPITGRIATRGEIRTFTLSDGSRVTLDAGSAMSLAFSTSVRRLRLEHGRARFEVFHEPRPFLVSAGDSLITARGTVFDVSIDTDQRVLVHLLQGVVDVAAASGAPEDQITKSRKMRVGEHVMIAKSEIRRLTAPKGAMLSTDWTNELVEFSDIRLEEILALANRHSSTTIVIATPHIANLKVSGRFRINDGPLLASHLAKIFNLDVDTGVTGQIVLRERH